MSEPGVDLDQRDFPAPWHLKAAGLAAAAVLAAVGLAIKIIL